MNIIFAVAIGGSIGAVARYIIGLMVSLFVNSNFPFATLLVNIIGSVMIGFFAAKFPADSVTVRGFIVTGILGGFTTFSAFSLETFLLYNSGHKLLAGLYVTLSIVICLLGVAMGDHFAKYSLSN